MEEVKPPIPLFDTIEYFNQKHDFSYLENSYSLKDIKISTAFLKCYNGSRGTFDSYRREVERLLHWCALVASKSLKDLKRDDIAEYLSFCQNPPKSWLGKSKPAKFIIVNGERVPNPKWRPFIVTVSKIERFHGKKPRINQFELSNDNQRIICYFK